MARDYEEILKKLRRLANDKAFIGESKTAEEFIEKLAKKYKVDLDDILREEEIYTRHWFKYDGSWAEWKLLVQIMSIVTYSHNEQGLTIVPNNKNKKQLACECSDIEAFKIEAMFNFYKEKLFKDIQTLFTSFVMEHNLYRPTPAVDIDEISKEERERWYKARMMRMSLEKGNYIHRDAIEDRRLKDDS